MISSDNYYEILNISISASVDEIKTAYRKMALQHHPDKNNNSTESNLFFRIIHQAYETLVSSERRKEYDRWLNTIGVINKAGSQTNIQISERERILSQNFIAKQFNYILWEIEDLFREFRKLNGEWFNLSNLKQTIAEILFFFDTWVLHPAGFSDYFYTARQITSASKKESLFLTSSVHNPYANLEDYFYQIRIRMNQFIDKIHHLDFLGPISGQDVNLLDSILESHMMSFHYLGAINAILHKHSTELKPYQFIHSCFMGESIGLVNYQDKREKNEI